MLSDCHWPDLPSPFDEALREAIAFVLSRFRVIGLVAAGTIIGGAPDPTSDLDIYVIHRDPFRQRIQKHFREVPAELFVNPVAAVHQYFDQELVSARPSTAHMLATGFVVLDSEGIVADLRRRAADILRAGPHCSEISLTALRYQAATLYEDATDVVERDPVTANLLLSRSVDLMLEWFFKRSGLFIPRTKSLVSTVRGLQPELAELLVSFLTATDAPEKVALAGKIADRTIGERGFFEWESAPSEVR